MSSLTSPEQRRPRDRKKALNYSSFRTGIFRFLCDERLRVIIQGYWLDLKCTCDLKKSSTVLLWQKMKSFVLNRIVMPVDLKKQIPD